MKTISNLDMSQYSIEEIEKYEAIYGKNFISPGGIETARDFIGMLNLSNGMRVLDVGSGLGGSAFLMAREYKVQVHGIDISANMLNAARIRCQEEGLAKRVTFELADILNFSAAFKYDRIYSRDVFLHIPDKAKLMNVLKRSLKKDGQLLFTDYCCGEVEKSEDFQSYIRKRNYSLLTLAAYRDTLAQAGFTGIIAEDRTRQFIEIHESDLANIYRAPLSIQARAELDQSWRAKLERARRGEQRWGLFIAHAST